MPKQAKPMTVAKLIDESCRIVKDGKPPERCRLWSAVDQGWLTDGRVAIQIPQREEAKVRKMVESRVQKYKLERPQRPVPMHNVMPSTRQRHSVLSRRVMSCEEIKLVHDIDFSRTVSDSVTRIVFDPEVNKDRTSYFFDTSYILLVEKLWPSCVLEAYYTYNQYSGWYFDKLCFYDPTEGLVGLLMRLSEER